MKYVRALMTSPVISVTPDTPLKTVARLLVEHGISGLPVVDGSSVVVGVVSEADFLIKGQGVDRVSHRRFNRVLGESSETRSAIAKLDAETAGAAMTKPAVTIGPQSSTREAATLMTSRSINRLPVIEDQRLIGIITRADLVRTFVRSDEELTHEIREEVLWLEPTTLSVSVSDGVASIAGSVEDRPTAEILPRLVALIPGIVGVHAAVTWLREDVQVAPPSDDPGYFTGFH